MPVAGNPNQDLHEHIIEYSCKSMDSLKDYKTLRFLKLRGYLSISSLVFGVAAERMINMDYDSVYV